MSLESGPAPSRFGYRPEFDGVRGIAIVLVVWHHLGFVGVPRVGAGFLGVDIFFVLSGYLITSLLLDENRATGTVRMTSFYVRRALRLLPALALMLVVAGIVVYASGRTGEPTRFLRALPWVVLYAGNWHIGSLGILTHTWTLAIEEQFYLLWPPVVVLSLRHRVDRRLLVGALLGSVVALAVVAALWGAVPARPLFRPAGVFVETYTRAGGILLGCLVALLPQLRRHVSDLVGTVAVIGAAAVLIVRKDPSTFHFRIGYVAFVAFTAVALAHVVHYPDSYITRALRWRPLVATGRVSYGIYLFHVPAIVFIAWEQPVPFGWAAGIAALGATAVLTAWSWFVVERPALRLKKRFSSRDAPDEADQIARANAAE